MGYKDRLVKNEAKLSLRLSKEMFNKLKTVSKVKGKTMSEEIRGMIKRGLDEETSKE